MKLCPKCRTQNDNDAKFCKECATSFTVEEEKCVESPLISQKPAAPVSSFVQEEKNHAPLDFLIEDDDSKTKKSTATSVKQLSFWQKTKDSIKENYYVMFFLVMIVLVFVVLIIGVNSSNRELTTTNTSSGSSLTSDEVIPEIVKVSESDITEIDYTYLVNNYDKYNDSEKYFRVSGCIDFIGDNYVRFGSLDKDYLVVYFQQGVDLSGYYTGSYITTVGQNEEKNDNWIRFAYIEESGDKAEQTFKRLKAAGDKLREADKKAKQEKAKKDKKDYIASCKTYKYKDIRRNPDKFKGKKAKFKGKVVQVIEGDYYTVLRVNVTKGKYGIYSDTIYVIYIPESSTESRILEDDIVTLYGELAGIETYETVMGTSVSIPKIYAKYLTINSK